MNDKTTHQERRRSNRCNLRADDYKIIIGPSRAVGDIKDISLHGLAFTYVSMKGNTFEDKSINTLAIDYGGYKLSEITCNKIYDIRVLSEGLTFSGKTTRRCGVRFTNLSILNKFKIKQILHICRSRILENVSKYRGLRYTLLNSI
jgi:hypothetical protein